MKILQLVAADLPTSVPIEMISHMMPIKGDTDIKTVAFYQFDHKPKNDFMAVDDYIDFNKFLPFKGVARLYRIIKEYRPDVLHLHHGLSAFLGAIIGKLLGVQLMIKTEHRSHQINRVHARLLTTGTFILCDQIICNSLATLSSFSVIDKWIAGNHALVIYNGIDPASIENTWISSQRETAMADKSFVIVSTTRLIAKKNTSTLVTAFQRLYEQYDHLRLQIVGDGPERGHLESQVQALGLGEVVEFTGLVSRKRVFELISMADLFCLIPFSEGFCNALIEAMVARCPVVASNIPAIREVTGLSDNVLVTPDDIDAIERGIEDFVNMPEKQREEIGKRNNHFAVDRYSLQMAASKHLKLYHDLLDS